MDPQFKKIADLRDERVLLRQFSVMFLMDLHWTIGDPLTHAPSCLTVTTNRHSLMTPLNVSVVLAFLVFLYLVRRSTRKLVSDLDKLEKLTSHGRQCMQVLSESEHQGEDRLLVSDPKAIQYTYHSTRYKFSRPSGRKEMIALLMRESDDAGHPRHGGAVEPAFGISEIRTFVPTFFSCGGKLVSKWQDMISLSGGESAVIGVAPEISDVILDVIGQAVFDIDLVLFEGNEKHFLAEAYANIL
ncbi:hypothetical protein DFS33DRAFT_1317145 [Desarmillaria ectypa]|nr:hypothetical protein DFS33DRAFT_1317145 [Desarmillaria ectypa]